MFSSWLKFIHRSIIIWPSRSQIGYSVPSGVCEPVVIQLDPVSFSKRLKEARVRAGLTQLQVADACGLTKGAVSAWEQGITAGIIAENLFCVADVLGVDPRFLATGVESKEASAQGIIKDISHLPSDQQEIIRALIHSLQQR